MAYRRRLPLFTVDAFTKVPFSGNPAAVCLDVTETGLDEALMQAIAAEMNISETAFVRPLNATDTFKSGSKFGLRWFTPTNEVPLCGHATLASSAALFHQGNQSDELFFETLSGQLTAKKRDKLISLDLPLSIPEAITLTSDLKALLDLVVAADIIDDIHYSATTKKLLVVLCDKFTRSHLEGLQPKFDKFLDAHNTGKVKGIIVTLKGRVDNGCVDADGEAYEFVSRYFAPWNGINEDPVTGAAHTVLAGYWSRVLNKKSMYARQCSPRGGDLRITVRDDGRVELAGNATVVIEGHISV